MAFPSIQVITRKDTLRNPLNLNNLNSSVLYMNERHDKAMQQMGENNAYLGKLLATVDESERPKVTARWRAYMDQVNDKVDKNSGYVGNAYADSIRIGTEAAGDYFFIGRQQAKLDHDKFIDNLDKMKQSGLITDLTYNRLKEQNPYYYNDKFNNEYDTDVANRINREQQIGVPEHGITEKVSGGTTWKPTTEPVRHYAFSDIVDRAMSHVKAESGGNLKVSYLDKDGNPTPYKNKSVDGQWYSIEHGQYTRLSADKIANAIRNEIDSNPEFRESIIQDLNDMKFDYTKHSENYNNGGDLLRADGVPRSFNDYVDHIIEDYAKNNAINSYVPQIQFNSKAIEDAAARRNAAANALGLGNETDNWIKQNLTLSSLGIPLELTKTYKASDSFAEINKQTDIVNEILSKYKDIDPNDFDLNDPKLSPQDKYTLKSAYQIIENQRNLLNILLKDATDQQKEAVEFIGQSGAYWFEENTNNRYRDRMSKDLMAIGADSDSKLRIVFDNEEEYLKFKTATGISYSLGEGEVPASSTVYEKLPWYKPDTNIFTGTDYRKLIHKKGDMIQGTFIDIPVTDYESMYLVANARGNSAYKGSTTFIDKDGNELKHQRTTSNSENSAVNILFNFRKMYDQAKKINDEVMTKQNTYNNTISNVNLSGFDFSSQYAKKKYGEESVEYSRVTKDLYEDLERKIRGDFANYSIWYSEQGDNQGNKKFIEDDVQKRIIGAKIGIAIKDGRMTCSPSINIAGSTNYGTIITVDDKVDNKGNVVSRGFEVYVDGLFKNYAADYFIKDTSVQAQLKYDDLNYLGNDYTMLGGLTIFDGTKITPLPHIGSEQTDYANITMTDGTSLQVDRESAQKLIDIELVSKDFKNRVTSGLQISETELEGIVNYIYNLSSTIPGFNLDKEYILLNLLP